MRNTLFLFLAFLTSSCKLSQNNIVGNYRDYYNSENSTTLAINKDQTFKYTMQSGLIFLISSGKWKIKRDTLFLENTDTSSINELKQIKFLIKGRKLLEVRDNKLPGITLK